MISIFPRHLSVASVRALALAVCTSLIVAACGGGSDHPTGSSSSSSSSSSGGAATYTISAAVSGLTGTVVLADNGGNNLTVTASGTFPFTTMIASGGAYAVTVATQPATQTCVVAAGSGTASANVTVTVTCTTNQYTISAAVGGLVGTVVLQDNGGNNLTVAASGTVPFTTKINSGGAYAVTVLTQPATQICAVTAGSGVAHANVTVTVTCVTQYTISATVGGLVGTVVLQDNGGNNLTFTTSATQAFTTKIAAGGAYAVTVFAQPAGQNCTVAAGSGVASANVTVTVTCTNQFTISAAVSGLNVLGSGVVLQDNGGNNLTVTTNGTFPFTTKVAAGSLYAVTVLTQPTGPAQHCTVAAGSGTASANTTVAVTCKNVGKFVFVVNGADAPQGSIAAFTIAPLTGALTLVGGAPVASTGSGPSDIALDPTGAFAYVTDFNSIDVDTYDIDPVTGALSATAFSTSTGAGTSNPYTVAVDTAASTGYVYVGSSTATTGTVGGYTAAAGTLTAIAAPYTDGNNPVGLAVDSANQLVFAANEFDSSVGCFAITTGTGALNAVTTTSILAGAGNPYAIAVAPAGGFLYVTDSVNNNVSAYSYTSCSDVAIIGATIPVGTGPKAIAIDPTGSYLYVSNSTAATVSAFTITPVTGALVSLGAAVPTGAATSASQTALVVDPSSQYLYVANGDPGTVTLFTIAAGGAITKVGAPLSSVSTGGGPSAIAIE